MNNKYLLLLKDNAIFVHIALLFMFEYRFYQFQTQMISCRDQDLEIFLSKLSNRINTILKSDVVNTNSTMIDNYIYPVIWVISIAFILYGGYTFVNYLNTPTLEIADELKKSIDRTINKDCYYSSRDYNLSGQRISSQVTELVDSPVASPETVKPLLEGLVNPSSEVLKPVSESLSPIIENISATVAENAYYTAEKLAILDRFFGT